MPEYRKDEVLYWPQAHPDDPASCSPGLNPNTSILPKGYTYREGRYPFQCDTVCEQDAVMTLSDGTVLYGDIYRPATEEKVPVILVWGSSGKRGRLNSMRETPKFPNYHPQDGAADGVRTGQFTYSELSGLNAWAGPDPAKWVQYGYAVANVDPRGVYYSQGDMQYFGSQYGRDGAEVVEWLSAQPWCNGRVGMSGSHWYGTSQWFVAAEKPPHLSAIFVSEGSAQLYVNELVRGGIPQLSWENRNRSFGCGGIEDITAMSEKHPLLDWYWADKNAKFENIGIPVFVLCSFTQTYHSRGIFEAFSRVSSKNKWMRIHNRFEFIEYRTDSTEAEERRFFDRYLKGLENGWEATPAVRLSILDPGHRDIVDIPQEAFPPECAETALYLHGAGILSEKKPEAPGALSYVSDDGSDQVSFVYAVGQDFDMLGFSALRLWIETDAGTDMDIFVKLSKLDRDGKELFAAYTNDYSGPNGRLRASHRELDMEKSTPLAPVHPHTREELVEPGQIVRVDIDIWPTAMRFHKGEKLELRIMGCGLKSAHMGTELQTTRNRGRHIIHTGGAYDSRLLIPVKRGMA